jgi:GTPase involved in cell partitioning and DNA repair
VPLATRSQLVVLNKTDVIGEEETLQLQSTFQKAGVETMAISAAARKGLRELVIEIGKRVLK